MNEFLNYVKSNWFQLIIDFIAAMNVIVAGARVMGWNKLADECGKLENAIVAMVNAALNRNKQNPLNGGIEDDKKDNVVVNTNPGDSNAKSGG